jgi:hypothetical protein
LYACRQSHRPSCGRQGKWMYKRALCFLHGAVHRQVQSNNSLMR